MTEEKNIKTEEVEVKFKGRFLSETGKRKTAVAQIRLYKNGTGIFMVNDQKATEYFNPEVLFLVYQPLKQTGHQKDFNFSVIVNGGGKKAQAIALRHGISKLLVSLDEEVKPSLRAKGFLTRDDRKKERKKPGLKKARRAPQWAKR
jgi:small subunit ribosomal protein S9